MEVEAGLQHLELEKLRAAHVAVVAAFGASSDEAVAVHAKLEKLVEARKAATPTHVQLQKVEKRLAAVGSKLEAAHGQMEELEAQIDKLGKQKQMLLEQGRSLQANHAALQLEKASILAQGQSRLGGHSQSDLEVCKMLGLGLEQAVQHPGLFGLLQQVHSLVAQIKSQDVGQQNEGVQPQSLPQQTQLEDSQVEGNTEAPGAWETGPAQEWPALQQDGKKEGKGAPRQRSAPYPQVAKEEAETVQQSFTGKDLGLEGQSAKEYDSQAADGGQQPFP